MFGNFSVQSTQSMLVALFVCFAGPALAADVEGPHDDPRFPGVIRIFQRYDNLGDYIRIYTTNPSVGAWATTGYSNANYSWNYNSGNYSSNNYQRNAQSKIIIEHHRMPHFEFISRHEFLTSDVKEIVVFAGGGDDFVINQTNVKSKLYGDAGNDYLEGGSNDDYLEGDSTWAHHDGQDWLVGNAGDDQLISGGNGISFAQDTLEGGPGKDILEGQRMGYDLTISSHHGDILMGQADPDIYRYTYLDYIYDDSDRFDVLNGRGGEIWPTFRWGSYWYFIQK